MLRTHPRPMNSQPSGAETSTSRATTVVVPERLIALRLQGPSLTIDALQSVLNSALRGQGHEVSEIALDFSEIDDLVGPWTIHLAILIDLSRRMPVHVCGLHGQPLQVVWLYRRSPEIRGMVGRPRATARPQAA